MAVPILWEISFLTIALIIGKPSWLLSRSIKQNIHGLFEQQMYWVDDKVWAEVLRMQRRDVSSSQDISVSARPQPVSAVSNADRGKGDPVIKYSVIEVSNSVIHRSASCAMNRLSGETALQKTSQVLFFQNVSFPLLWVYSIYEIPVRRTRNKKEAQVQLSNPWYQRPKKSQGD